MSNDINLDAYTVHHPVTRHVYKKEASFVSFFIEGGNGSISASSTFKRSSTQPSFTISSSELLAVM